MQLVGIVWVLYGIRETRRELGLPPTAVGRVLQRVKKLVARPFRKRQDAVVTPATIESHVQLSSAATGTLSPPWEQRDTGGKLEYLREQIKEQEVRIDELHDSRNRERRERESAVADEAASRERADEATKDLFARVTLGGLRLQGWAALPLVTGIVLAAFPGTFAGWANALLP